MLYHMKNPVKITDERKEDFLRPPKTGEIVGGKIIGIEKAAVFLDLGAWGTGIIYGREFIEGKDFLKSHPVGDKIFAKIVDLENDEGFIELSVSQAGKEITWKELLRKKEAGELINVKMQKANKGGLIAEINNIPAFLPVSQLAPEHYPRVQGGETSQILTELQKFIGKELEVKILDLNQRENQIILSEKAKEAEKIKEILNYCKIGDVVEGEISGVVDFGAFIKFPLPKGTREASVKEEGLDNLEGLIHISELDWKIIEDPSEIVQVGQKVNAKIIDITDDRVSLSLRALKKDPWAGIEEKYKKGDIVVGTVTKFNPFGAFIQIALNIQGLCHVSEFGSEKKMEESLEINKKYNFKILLIDPKDHRMTLRLER